MKSNIALIGFMGTGKTAVGETLANRLHKKFVELDALIEEQAGMPITKIFEKEGEIGFREREIGAVKEVVGRRGGQVIACGGGVVLNRINIDRLKEDAVVVLLTATPSTILKRTLVGGATRPLLNVPDSLTRIREMLKSRRPLYEGAADITVNTTGVSLEAVVDEIVRQLNEK